MLSSHIYKIFIQVIFNSILFYSILFYSILFYSILSYPNLTCNLQKFAQPRFLSSCFHLQFRESILRTFIIIIHEFINLCIHSFIHSFILSSCSIHPFQNPVAPSIHSSFLSLILCTLLEMSSWIFSLFHTFNNSCSPKNLYFLCDQSLSLHFF